MAERGESAATDTSNGTSTGTSSADTAVKADDTRSRLLSAAMEAFAEKGFHGTTTRDIAARAGMSPAAVYVHHRSKEDLLYLISRGGHEAALRVVRTAVDSATEPKAQLAEVMRRFARHHATAHTGARIVNYELAALSPEHLREIAGIRRAIENSIRDVVEAGAAAGDFHTSHPRMSALAVLSLCIDIARWYRDEGEWTPDDIGEHYAELGLRMVGARD